jgi:hypothetical protein
VIPLRDINPTSRTAWLTLAIVAANIAVFVLWEPTFAGQAEQQEFLRVAGRGPGPPPWEGGGQGFDSPLRLFVMCRSIVAGCVGAS